MSHYIFAYSATLAILFVIAWQFESNPKTRILKENVWALNIRQYSELMTEVSTRLKIELDRESLSSDQSTLPTPEIHPTSRYFEDPLNVRILSDDDAHVRVSFDGSVPTPLHEKARSYYSITDTTVLKAKAFGANGNFSDTVTVSYIAKAPAGVPVISLVMDPVYLYNKDVGIIANPLQKGRAWERPAELIIKSPGSDKLLEFGASVRVHGANSRTNPRKSLRLYVDKGNTDLISLFGRDAGSISASQTEWILRYVGNNRQFNRDRLARRIARQMDLIVGYEVSCILYVNGEIWGVYDLMERLNEQFVIGKVGDGTYAMRNGGLFRPTKTTKSEPLDESEDWASVYETIATAEIIDSQFLQWIDTVIDTEEFIDYMILSIYSADIDRPQRNMDLFREVSPGHKWRPILWDLDGGFNYLGLFTQHDSLAWHLREKPLQHLKLTGGADSSWKVQSTLILRRLLENNYFRTKFKARFSELLDTILGTENMNRTFEKLLSQQAETKHLEIERFYGKFSDSHGSDYFEQISQIRDFVDNREAVMRESLEKHFP